MFTFIMDFRGGTYISQVESNNLSISISCWGEKLKTTDIKYLGLKGKKELLSILKDADPTPLKGLKNVWFQYFLIYQGFITINIVKTNPH